MRDTQSLRKDLDPAIPSGSKNDSPRVIIHGCGNVGQRVTRFCQRKSWPIVAAYNRAGDKVGRDLGALAALDHEIGVPVRDSETLDLAQIAADIVVVATTDSNFLKPLLPTFEVYLSAGINVICHGSQPHNPFFDDPETAAKIDQIAKDNGVSFSGTSIWDVTRIWSGILAAGNSIQIERLVHTATSEPGRQNPLYEAGIGIGLSPYEFAQKFPGDEHPLHAVLHGPPVMVLQNLGCEITDLKKSSEPIILKQDQHSPHTEKLYPAGCVGGVRVIVDVETKQGILGRGIVEYRLFEPGEQELMHWNVIGLPSTQITVSREDASNQSAASIFNRIPGVIAAPPGITEIFRPEMGPMRSTALA